MDEITPAGFQLHHVPCRNKKGGGVAVFVRNDFDSVLCQTDHILDVLCTSKSLTSSVHHYVKDGISDHLAVFFTTTFPVKNICRVKCLKIRKLGKINKTKFISELIQAPYKTTSLLSHQYFHTLRNLLDKHASIHECKTPQHVNKVFINSDILVAKRLKRKLEREWRRDNSAINHSRYKAALNHFNRLLECAKTK